MTLDIQELLNHLNLLTLLTWDWVLDLLALRALDRVLARDSDFLALGLTMDNMTVWRTIILQAVFQDDMSILLLLDDFPQRILLLRILPILPLILRQIRPQMILFVS